MRRMIIALSLLAAACEEDAPKKDEAAAQVGGEPGPAPTAVDPVLDGWKSAGLTVGAFGAADGGKYGDGDCKAGSVSGLDTVVCRYESPELATAAEAKARDAAGPITGAAVAHGSMLLVVIDKGKVDREGRTINQMVRSFQGK